MIPREVIEEIVRRSDIEQVIGSYVSLKRAGSNMVGLCPFHSEKSPSFTVFTGTDSFYCFGCGAGGDVITFVMKAENVDYVTAIESLAARAGITVENDISPAERGPTRERIRAMNAAAAKYYHNCLLHDPAAGQALDYLKKKRRLTDATINRFYLGYAPNDFGRVRSYLSGQGFTDEEMITGFLCGKSQRSGEPYDYFRNRVMFPIVDTGRNIVGFGGRVMDDSKPKYLNTSDTPAFKKSRNLFALNYAKDYCSDEMILCEGYMDVIAMHMHGFQNAVATLGTAITEDHARLIAKYTKKVIVSYDSDEAGINAANKAMRVLSGVGVDVRILKIDGAKDPDEYLKEHTPADFRAMLNRSLTGFEYKLAAILAKYDRTQTDQRLRAASDTVAVIADYYSKVEREVYITRAAEALELPAEAVRNDVERLRSKKVREIQAEQNRSAHASIRDFGDKTNPDAAKNPRAAAAEEIIIGLLMIYSDKREAVASGEVPLTEDDFFTGLGKRAFATIMKLHSGSGGYMFSLLGGEFTVDEMSRLQECEVKRRNLTENGYDVLTAAVRALREERNKSQTGETLSLADELAAKRKKLEEERKKRNG